MQIDYPWPTPPGCVQPPKWTGQGFELDGQRVGVLHYEGGQSNWSDELTAIHEIMAGDKHILDVASRRHAVGQFLKHLDSPQSTILEIGCSSGYMLHELRTSLPQAAVIGSDYVPAPLEHLSKTMPDMPLLQFDLTKCPLPSNSLDAVVLLQVLEHIQDDATASREICRILKPGGLAVLEVPAGPSLYGVYDKVLMHCRRYSMSQFCTLLKNAGLEIVEKSHLGFFLYPGFWWVKRRDRRYLSADSETQKRILAENIKSSGQHKLMNLAIKLELALGKWIRYPIGIRCLVTARKPR